MRVRARGGPRRRRPHLSRNQGLASGNPAVMEKVRSGIGFSIGIATRLVQPQRTSLPEYALVSLPSSNVTSPLTTIQR